MSNLITLSKKDPRFFSYLNGNFSKTDRAIPVESLNVNTEAEQVTFQIVPLNEIYRPMRGLYWLRLLKVRNLVLVAFPVFLTLVKNWIDGTLHDPRTFVLGAVGAFFLMTAVNLRNDYLDHLSGLDRVHPQSGSQAIQKGWVTAAQVQRWSYFYLILGVVFGLPALVLYREVLILVGVFTLLGILGLTSYKIGLKYRRWSELTIFLLLGPLLTVGLQYSMGYHFDLEVLWIGAITGWMSVFYLHLKNFEQLMVNEQAQFRNTMTWLGFEKGKTLLFIWWLILAGLVMGYHFEYAAGYWRWVVFFSLLAATVPFGAALSLVNSPLGSKMTKLMHTGKMALYFVMMLIMIETLWYLWIFQ